MLQRLPSKLNGRTLNRAQVKVSYIFCVRLHLFRSREHLQFHDFVLPLLVACTISLCGHKHTVLGKSCATRGPVCTSEIYQWYGEPCFASVEISEGGCLPQIQCSVQCDMTSGGMSVWEKQTAWVLSSLLLTQPPAHAGSPLADSSTLKMEAIRSSETSVNARSTQPHIPEDYILHSHRCESLKSYIRVWFSQEMLSLLPIRLASRNLHQ
jgi:hypothetical protein